MVFEADLLQRTAVVCNLLLLEALQRTGLDSSLIDRLQPLLLPAEFIVMVVASGAAITWLDRRWRACQAGSREAWILAAGHAAAGVLAATLLCWVYTHPGAQLESVPGRWDYLAAIIFAGLLLQHLSPSARAWTLAILSAAVLQQYVGLRILLVVATPCLLGFACTRMPVTDQPERRPLVHGLLLLAALAWLWWRRGTNGLEALIGWGLFSFVLFRHISFVVEHARGASSTLGGYVCYVLFFPNAAGAAEVYEEFSSRNLAEPMPSQFPRATRLLVTNYLLLWTTLQFDMSATRVVESSGFVAMWGATLALFLRAAVATMGIWGLIEGGALFLGIELRRNFRYVLVATNPSQFWRAWRATMTNWLIHYIYIPLGGNRRHQTLNIAAAFAVSTVWHCAGVFFLLPTTWTRGELEAVGLWGAVNCAGVALHALVRRHRPARRYAGPAHTVVIALKWALTMVYGSFTVLLLGLSLGKGSALPHVVRTILGLNGW